jgi:hypothetical protein
MPRNKHPPRHQKNYPDITLKVFGENMNDIVVMFGPEKVHGATPQTKKDAKGLRGQNRTGNRPSSSERHFGFSEIRPKAPFSACRTAGSLHRVAPTSLYRAQYCRGPS